MALELNPGLLSLPETINSLHLLSEEKIRERLDDPELSQRVIGSSEYRQTRRAALLSTLNFSVYASRAGEDTSISQYGVGASFIWDTKSPFLNSVELEDCIEGPSTRIRRLEQERIEQITQLLRRELGQEPTAQERDALTNGLIVGGSFVVDQGQIATVLRDVGLDEALAADILTINRRFNEGASQADESVSGCLSRVTRWNRDVYGVGVAGYIGTDEDDNSSTSGIGLWFSLARQLGDDAQLIVSGRWIDDLLDAREVDGETVSETVDILSAGARLTYELASSADQSAPSARATRGFIEAGYFEKDFADIEDKYWQLGVGGEFQLRKDLFVQFVVGETIGSELDRSEYLSSQLKWSFAKTSAR